MNNRNGIRGEKASYGGMSLRQETSRSVFAQVQARNALRFLDTALVG